MNQKIFVKPGEDLQRVWDHAPAGSEIFLSEGVYRQKTLIRMPGLRITGAGKDKTILIFDDYALKTDQYGREYNTFRTYTCAVCADDIRMEGLSIVNDALHPELKGQEVALSVLGNHFLMKDCILSSTQDTLFAGPLPPDLIERYSGFLRDELRRPDILEQRYENCRIEGTVDFIFGCANAVFDRCEIRSLLDARHIGYAAAPAHGLSQKEGFLFKNCRFSCEAAVDPGSIFLARPWRDYGLAAFENCSYDHHIASEGFDKWDDTSRDRTARFYESPAVPGRVSWINRES